MQTLPFVRHAHLLARFVLVWFALSIGVAIASPIVKPQVGELICSGAGVKKVLLKTDDGTQAAVSLTMDCPVCVTHSAPPPPAARLATEPPHALAHVLQRIPAAHIVSRTAAPPPARGPPVFF